MTPSPFEVSQAFANNVAGARQNVKDRSAIDEILMQANQSGKPEDINMAMAKILSRVSPERQAGALAILQNKQQMIQQQAELARKEKERERIGKAHKDAGFDESAQDLSPQLLAQLAKNKQAQEAFNNLRPKGGQPRINAPAKSTPENPTAGDNNPPAMSPLPTTEGNMPVVSGQEPPSANMEPQSQGGLSDFSDDELIAMTSLPGYSEPAKQELNRRQKARELEQRKGEKLADRHNKVSEKVLERADEVAEMLPQKRTALNMMKDAIARKDFSFWSQDNLAEITGIEGLRSPEGAIFKTAGKEYFLGSIARAGARPNQWIEQQIQDMMTKIGRSTEANLSVSRALENELDLETERVRLTHDIADRLEKSVGGEYVSRNLGRQVNEELTKFAEKKQIELFNDLRAIKAIGEGKKQEFKKVSAGTPISRVVAKALLEQVGNDPKKAEQEAVKLGYIF